MCRLYILIFDNFFKTIEVFRLFDFHSKCIPCYQYVIGEAPFKKLSVGFLGHKGLYGSP